MEEEILKPHYLYQQVASRVADAITRGEYPPGTMLPSETDLMARYNVSRPTARAAVGELRAMGLVESQRGKGSFVREPAAHSVAVQQAITRQGKRYSAYDAQFTETESPHVTRTHTEGTEAQLLQRDDEAAFAVERLLTDTTTGLRACHRTVIPFDVTNEHPELAKDPATNPAGIYALLAAGGHSLTWQEYISARPATPDDRATLHASDSTWLLVSHRVTHGADGRPLLLEVLTSSAERAHLAYGVTAQRTPAKKA